MNLLSIDEKTVDNQIGKEVFLNSFKRNLLKKKISEIINEKYKKKYEYEKKTIENESEKIDEIPKIEIKEKEIKENEKKELEQKPKIFKKMDSLKEKLVIDPTQNMINSFINVINTEDKGLDKKLKILIRTNLKKISKEILSEIIPKKYEINELTTFYINKMKNEIIKNIKEDINNNKNEYLKEFFVPLIFEYKKDLTKNNSVININNISIINYIIKLCEKTEKNKKYLEINNIYLIKYTPILPKGKCKSNSLMFFDETLKGKIIEQQTLMLYLGDLKFSLLCNDYNTKTQKPKIKRFKKYEDFEILSIIKKDKNYELKMIESNNNEKIFFNKFYSLELKEESSEIKINVGGFFDSIKNRIKKEKEERRNNAMQNFIKQTQTQNKKVNDKTIINGNENETEILTDSDTETDSVKAAKLVEVRKKIANEKMKEIEKVVKNAENKMREELNAEKEEEKKKEETLKRTKTDNDNYNIIGDIVKFEFSNNPNYQGEFYGIIFKKINEEKYEILFRNDREKKGLNIKYEGKIENDYLHSFEVYIKKGIKYHDINYNVDINLKFNKDEDDKNKIDENDIDVKLCKIFTYYNYYKNIKTKILTFRKIINDEDIPFFNEDTKEDLKKKIGILFDVVFYDRELKLENRYFNNLKLKNQKSNKCSNSFNKKIKCLFLFTDENGSNIYLKAEHYAEENPKQITGGKKTIKKTIKKNIKKQTKRKR